LLIVKQELAIMRINLNCVWKLGALSFISLLFLTPYSIKAQSNIESRCVSFDPSILVTGPILDFPGSYYYTTRIGSVGPDYIWEFGVTDATEQRIIQAPFSQEIAQRITFPRISPDGTKMAFIPLFGTEIMVWNVTTGEIASLAITEELAEYLRQYDAYNIRAFNKLVWISASEIALQYFHEYSWDISNPVFRVNMSVSEQPLSITLQTSLPAGDLEAVQPTISPSNAMSPNGRYQLDMGIDALSFPYPQPFQVIDTRTNQVVLEVELSQGVESLGEPIWSADENRMLYVEQVVAGTQLAEYVVRENFRRDTRLNTLLEIQFGTSTGISSLYPVLLSPDGTHIAFGYVNQQSNNEYSMIRYDLVSGELVVVCDDSPTSGGIYPFWAPTGHRFAAYWYGNVKVYDFETGNRYLLPGNSFVGWIP
jgi:hypothetical protein